MVSAVARGDGFAKELLGEGGFGLLEVDHCGFFEANLNHSRSQSRRRGERKMGGRLHC